MNIYNVMYSCDYVGEFLQACFSTKEKAEDYVSHNPMDSYIADLYIVEYELDSE